MPVNKKKSDSEKDQPQDQIPAQRAGGNSNPDENIYEAHEQAEKDIEQDPDLSLHSPNDDLDEGEIARLGEDKTDLTDIKP